MIPDSKPGSQVPESRFELWHPVTSTIWYNCLRKIEKLIWVDAEYVPGFTELCRVVRDACRSAQGLDFPGGPMVVVQVLSHVQLFATPWTEAHQASMSFTISWGLLKYMSIESVMSSNHLVLCRPVLLLPTIFLSIRVFSNELAHHIRWPKYWSFNFSVSPSNAYSRLLSFRIDWFDPLAVQGTLRVFSSTTIQKHQLFGTQAFFMVQLSHPYMTIGKSIDLTVQTFVGKVMSVVLICCLGLS